MEDLQQYFAMVERVITGFGVDPAVCRGDKPGMWRLYKGSAEVWIDIWHVEREERAYFQAMSPVMPVPTQNREAFYKELLELSDQMYGVAFTIYKDWAYIKVIREVNKLDQDEIEATLNRVGIYADDYDDMLKTKYGNGGGANIVPGAPPVS